MIDAYAHIGYPRYGTPDELISVWRQWGIGRGCIALPPGMPDFDGLDRAREVLGDAVRLFGIPYGSTPADAAALAEMQIQFGISGMRLAPSEITGNPNVLAILGEAGCCLMAIGIYESAGVTRDMIDWLDRYPAGTIAAPHFLKPSTIEAGAEDPGAFRELLRHPRFHAIFSRHGGTSAAAYPHKDLRPWVEEVISLLGWERVLWGSEIPVIYHRDEQVDGARDWLKSLGVGMGPEEEAAYLHGNAARLFFPQAGAADPTGREAPADELRSAGNAHAAGENAPDGVQFPPWVKEGLQSFIAANGAVPVIRSGPLQLPLDLHGALMSRYLVFQQDHPATKFQEWLVGELRTLIDGTTGLSRLR